MSARRRRRSSYARDAALRLRNQVQRYMRVLLRVRPSVALGRRGGVTGAECYKCGWAVSDKFATAPGAAPTSTRRAIPARSRSRRPAASGGTPDATGAAAGGAVSHAVLPLVQPPAAAGTRKRFFEGECPHCSRGVDDLMNTCPWCGGDSTGRDLIPRALTRVRRLLLVSQNQGLGYRILAPSRRLGGGSEVPRHGRDRAALCGRQTPAG